MDGLIVESVVIIARVDREMFINRCLGLVWVRVWVWGRFFYKWYLKFGINGFLREIG